MEEKELKSFPFDSMKVLNEESEQMENDREYEAQIFRDYFKKFLSNGVYFGKYKNYGENSMKVVADVGLNIKILKGAGFIEGVDYELEEDVLFTLERPNSGNRIDRVVVQMNASLDERKTKIIIKQGNKEVPAELTRTENIYEICIAEVTISSSSNITSSNIKDTRLDTNLCGIVNSLISVDGNEMYKKFQQYIDEVTNNLVRKDQNSTINGDIIVKSLKDNNNRSLSKNDFTDLDKSKLDGIEAGATRNIGAATAYSNGLMSASDKSKLDGIEARATRNIGTATTSSNGLMSYSDKAKLNAIPDGNVLANKFDGKAPTNHANASSTYGLGTRSVYGHVKITNNLLASAYTDGEVLSAYQGYVLNQKILNLENKIKELQSKVSELEKRIK